METKLVNLVPLNGTDYATWKVQCKMTLIRDGVWNIVNGTEIVPDSRTEMGLHAKYLSRKDRALATIVLSLEPFTFVPNWGSRRSGSSMEKINRPVSEEDVG